MTGASGALVGSQFSLSGYAGVNGTVGTGIRLYMALTGDRFFESADSPSDEELLARLRA
jgi:hypothetical protein